MRERACVCVQESGRSNGSEAKCLRCAHGRDVTVACKPETYPVHPSAAAAVAYHSSAVVATDNVDDRIHAVAAPIAAGFLDAAEVGTVFSRPSSRAFPIDALPAPPAPPATPRPRFCPYHALQCQRRGFCPSNPPHPRSSACPCPCAAAAASAPPFAPSASPVHASTPAVLSASTAYPTACCSGARVSAAASAAYITVPSRRVGCFAAATTTATTTTTTTTTPPAPQPPAWYHADAAAVVAQLIA